MREGQTRPAWLASLAIHAALAAALGWWLTERLAPTPRPEVAPVRLSLAMFQPPAPLEAPAPVEPAPAQEVAPPQAVPESPAAPPPEPKPVRSRPARPAPPKPAAPALEPLPVQSGAAPELAVSPPAVPPVPVEPPPLTQPVLPAPDPALEEGYRARIRQTIDAHKHYPRLARRLGHEGRVVVAFTIEADGRLAGVRVVESSGSELLDEAALEAVREAAPFPPFPSGISRKQWSFTLPLSFTLSE